jgi:hypothetical protein
MNFYCDSTGSIIHVDPEQIYQGSANVNAVNFIGAFPANAKVLVQYQLPNKRWTAPQLMAYNSVLSGVQDVQGNAYNVWHAMLGSRFDGEKFVPDFLITENYGTVKIQFQVIMANGDGEPTTLAVAESAIEVLKTTVFRETVQHDGYNALIQQVLSELTKANQSKYISEINLVRSEAALDIYRIVYNDNSFTEFSINKTFVASTGAAILKTEFVGVDQATGGYKYRQTYDNGTIAYFVAPPGSAGPQGPEGPAGPQGATGAKINSITFKRLVEGTVEGALYEMEFDNGVKVEFVAPKGPQGDTGRDGQDGKEGKSAYDIWLESHYGTQEAFFEFLKGETGPRGEQGETGPKGPEGPQGTSGVYTLSEGEDIDDVPDGYNVVIAELGVDDGTVLQGPQGPQGEKGEQGPQGPKGEIGPQGPQGEQGKQGPKGDTGATGQQGPEGVGISKAEINSSGELVITYTNRTITTLGKVVGADGKNGSNGSDGKDGFSPTVTITAIEGGTRVTITDKSGVPKSFDVLNGKDGTGGSGSCDGSVDLTGVLKYTTQTLTEDEQAQARTNIGAEEKGTFTGPIIWDGCYAGKEIAAVEEKDGVVNCLVKVSSYPIPVMPGEFCQATVVVVTEDNIHQIPYVGIVGDSDGNRVIVLMGVDELVKGTPYEKITILVSPAQTNTLKKGTYFIGAYMYIEDLGYYPYIYVRDVTSFSSSAPSITMQIEVP